MTSTTALRICPLCEACCGLQLRLEDGRVADIRGDAQDPFSRGFVCPKGVALKELHDDPDRLRRPLLKRDGRFVEVGWDEAFAEVARRLPAIAAQHGKDAVAVTLGNPIVHKLPLSLSAARLVRALGTRHVFSASTLDQMPKWRPSPADSPRPTGRRWTTRRWRARRCAWAASAPVGYCARCRPSRAAPNGGSTSRCAPGPTA